MPFACLSQDAIVNAVNTAGARFDADKAPTWGAAHHAVFANPVLNGTILTCIANLCVLTLSLFCSDLLLSP